MYCIKYSIYRCEADAFSLWQTRLRVRKKVLTVRRKFCLPHSEKSAYHTVKKLLTVSEKFSLLCKRKTPYRMTVKTSYHPHHQIRSKDKPCQSANTAHCQGFQSLVPLYENTYPEKQLNEKQLTKNMKYTILRIDISSIDIDAVEVVRWQGNN